mmetsp:Transcript_8738/g.22905  ORF Transcript_8738/g.22905 Transcript_8738/m.22905 type:complete len:128 (+) Transcript_8738:80-463(+)
MGAGGGNPPARRVAPDSVDALHAHARQQQQHALIFQATAAHSRSSILMTPAGMLSGSPHGLGRSLGLGGRDVGGPTGGVGVETEREPAVDLVGGEALRVRERSNISSLGLKHGDGDVAQRSRKPVDE